MFTFQWPWLILLLPLPLLVKRFYPSRPLETNRVVLLSSTIQRLQQAFSQFDTTHASSAAHWYTRLLWLCWFGLVGALMYPQWLDQRVEITQSGYDLMLAVDLSGSMETPDFFTPQGEKVNRFEAVKWVLGPFIQRRVGDRIGLILFADNAYLQAPLTLDTAAVNSLLKKAMLGMAGRDTAIGDAIGLAVKKLRERPKGSRVLILLTDGESNAGTLSPFKAAQLAKQYDILIYTIGVGSKDLFRHGLNEEPLKQIAQLTGGAYFPATDLDALTQVYAHIDKTLKKTEAESRIYLQRSPLYQFPLGLAMLALFALQLLNLRSGELQ